MGFPIGYVPQSEDLGAVETAIVKAVSTLSRLEMRIDTIMCTGVSGLLVAPQVAYRLGAGLFVARKPGDACHGNRTGCGPIGGNIVFLDDIISTGATFRRVVCAADGVLVERCENREAVFIGAYMYGSLYGTPAGWITGNGYPLRLSHSVLPELKRIRWEL